MTTARFLGGVLLTFVAFAPLLFGTDQLRRVALPEWSGLEAALVDAVGVLSATVVVTEALGTFSLFAPVPVAIGLALAGVLAWGCAWWWRRARPGRRAIQPAPVVVPDRLPRWARAGVVGGIALVVGSWVSRTVHALQHGITTIDSLWYHLPIAVYWVQTRRTTGIKYFDSDPVTAFYPASSSLFHGVGFLFFRTDLVSTIINLGWLALALAGAWAAGRAFGVGPAAALGAAILLGTAGMIGTQPGGAYDDVVGLALLLVAVALALHRRDEPRRIAHFATIGLALGLCVGSKYTLVGPAVLLALGIVITSVRGQRLRATVALFVSALVTGAYWYARNIVVVGNPLPSLAVHVGPLSLPSLKSSTPTSSVVHFLFDSRAWHGQMLPGLRLSLGPAWPALVALSFAGMVAAVFDRRERVVQMLGVVAALSFVAYLVTPQFLVALGRPIYFGVNVRYASPALALGLVLLPIALRRWAGWVTGALAAVLVVTELDPTAWPTGFGWATFEARIGWGDALWAIALVLVAALVALAAVALWRRAGREPTRVRRRGARWAVVGAVALLVLLGLTARPRRVPAQPLRRLQPVPRR